jgi:Ca2+-binding RTX toxin-like protein
MAFRDDLKDTDNADHYSRDGGEYYANFVIPKGSSSQFQGHIGGTDTSDYFVIDLKASGLSAGDILKFVVTPFTNSAITLESNGMSYQALYDYGPYSDWVIKDSTHNSTTFTIPESSDVLAFQVYNYSEYMGNYLIDIAASGSGEISSLKSYIGQLQRSEVFRLQNEPGRLFIDAGDGDDFVLGGKASDTIYGGFGRDILVGGPGDDYLYGYRKSDISGLGASSNQMMSDDGNDTFGMGDSPNQILGGDGNDRAYGGAAGDYVHGEDGDDELYGMGGADLIYGGYGNDLIRGGSGNDQIWGGSEVVPRGDWFGEPIRGAWDGATGGGENWAASIAGRSQPDDTGNDVIYAEDGDDFIVAGLGDDIIDGGVGFDRAQQSGLSRNLDTNRNSDGSITIHNALTGETDIYTDVERIAATDATLALDVGVGEVAGMAYRLYQAAFDRTPDGEGLSYWIGRLDSGTTNLAAVADSFIHSPEFIQTYGTPETVTNAQYVELLYNHTLGRISDSQGFDYWVNKLDHDTTNRADLLAFFSESDENFARVEPDIQDGIWLVA